MTDQKNTDAAPQQAQISDEQVQLLRSSLIQMAFAKYQELIGILKKLPIHQQIPGMIQAYLFIDSGMLWVKEILNTSPLMFTTAQPPLNEDKKEEEKAADSIAENNDVKKETSEVEEVA